MHPIGHPRSVRVPGHQVAHRLSLAQQILVNQARPDQVVRPKHLERAGHLAGVEPALFPHHVLEESHLTVIDEQLELTRLLKINLCSE